MTGVLDRFRTATSVVDENHVEMLSTGDSESTVVEIIPPGDAGSVPASIPRFVGEVMELQTRLFGLLNASPVTVFEIRRDVSDRVRLQLAVPTKRLERKCRLHLKESVPGVGFDTGVSGLPVSPGDAVSGGLLTTGRADIFPLGTSFDRPPTNNIVAPLHRDAFPSESVIIQIPFRPVAGRPIREWRWKRRAYQRIGFLKKEKHATVPWQRRPATKAERKQADVIEKKARNPQFFVGIRFLFVGTQDDFVQSRVKELGGAYNVYESDVTGQYLDTYTVSSFFPSRLQQFAESVAYRRSDDGWVLPFRAGIPELAGLIAVPTIDQHNLRRAAP